jgi:isopentenyldiphosphate isomerase
MNNHKPSREADSPEEVLDLVDDNDQVIGRLSRREIYAQGLRNSRVVHAFIKNSEGKLWIPRRVATKKLYPAALDFSVAGHVESGETYEEALFKESREEVNIDLNIIPYVEIAYLYPTKHKVGLFQKVYEIKLDTPPNYNPDDFSGYEWLSPEEVVSRAEAGEDMKSDIPRVIKICYLS